MVVSPTHDFTIPTAQLPAASLGPAPASCAFCCSGAASFPRCCQCAWARGSRRMLERSVQRIEERHPLGEHRVIVGMRELQAVDHVTNCRSLGSAKPVVLQIEVMNDRGNPGDGSPGVDQKLGSSWNLRSSTSPSTTSVAAIASAVPVAGAPPSSGANARKVSMK